MNLPLDSHARGECRPLHDVHEVRRHVNNALALHLRVVVPFGALERRAVHELAEVVHRLLDDGGILRSPLLLLAVEEAELRKLVLEYRGDLAALGHDVGEVEPLLLREPRRLLGLLEHLGGYRHRLVREDVAPRLDRRKRVVALAVVLACEDDDRLFAELPVLSRGGELRKVVVAAIDVLLPRGRGVLARVERLDQLEVVFKLDSVGGEYRNFGIHLRT